MNVKIPVMNDHHRDFVCSKKVRKLTAVNALRITEIFSQNAIMDICRGRRRPMSDRISKLFSVAATVFIMEAVANVSCVPHNL